MNEKINKLLQDERKMVGLWAEIHYVREDGIDATNTVELDALETEVFIRLLQLINAIQNITVVTKTEAKKSD